jgi:hypothetical protein
LFVYIKSMFTFEEQTQRDMNEVTLTMTDLLSNETVTRTIDISNAYVSRGSYSQLGNKEEQRIGLENWITERGNDQHEAILQLDSWKIS